MMTPYRLDSAAGIAGSVRHAFAAPNDPTAGVLAGLVALFAAFWNVHVLALLILVIIGGGVDLLTGARRARIRKRLKLPGGFDRAVLDEGASGKLLYLIVVMFVGMSADVLLSLLGDAGEMNIGWIFQTITPATTAALAWRLAREVGSVAENVEGTPGGQDVIWPGVRRFVDALRFRMAHPEAEGRLPNERWGDNMSPEERAWISEQLDERRAAGEPEP